MKKNRRGFTLIELMVVIAIIIILAAVAIPNYLNMTARAKRSRIASDFASLATALESYNTDWNTYPVVLKANVGTDGQIASGKLIFGELTGGTGATRNIAGAATTTGEMGPITYIQDGTLKQMVNPLVATGSTNQYYSYYTPTVTGSGASAIATTWVLYAYDGTTYYSRTNSNTTLNASTTQP